MERLKVLCVFGRYQYGDPARGEGVEYASFVPALRALGYEVRHFESWDRRRHADFAELNRRLLDEVETFRPDVMLTVFMEYELWIETLDAIRARGDVATVSWAADDSWKYREVSRFVGSFYHAMTTTYDYMLPCYLADDIRQVILTQWATSSMHLAEPLTAKVCRYPVSFVGAAHGDRRSRIDRLREAGIEVVCFGYGWENGPVEAYEMFRIMRESVISLNFANSKGADQIKARCFEVPGAGGFLLTEKVNGIEQFYLPEQEIATFGSDDELVRKITHYLANSAERDQIALAGYQRTLSEHTYERRLEAVLAFALAARDAAAPSPVVDFAKAIRRHRLNIGLRLLRTLLVAVTTTIFGRQRGLRAARRLVFELSWRLAGRHTFTAAGWPGRMFPDC
jgi:spore maturation protein CgeB